MVNNAGGSTRAETWLNDTTISVPRFDPFQAATPSGKFTGDKYLEGTFMGQMMAISQCFGTIWGGR